MKFVRQLGLRDCGAACLAMILTHHGRATSLSQARVRTPVGRDGVTAAAIVSAAQAEGLSARGRLLGDAFDWSTLTYPLIAHWKADHFVVIRAVSSDTVDVLDPSLGPLRLPRSRLQTDFSGVVLEFAPDKGFEPRDPLKGEIWRRYWDSVRLTPGFVAQLSKVLGVSTTLQLLLLLSPLVTWFVVDRILGTAEADLMTIAVLAALVITFTAWGARIAEGLALIALRKRVDHHLETRFVTHAIGLDLEFFDAHSTGDLLGRFSAVSQVRQVLTENLLTATIALGFFVVYLAILAIRMPVFCVVVVLAGAIYAGALAAAWGRLHMLRQHEIETEAQEKTALLQMVRGIVSVKAMGAEPFLITRWTTLFSRALDASIDAARSTLVLASVGPGVAQVANFALLLLGAQMVLADRVSIGEMLALIGVGVLAISPFQTFVTGAQQILQAQAQVERLLEVLHTQPAPARVSTGGRKIDFQGAVELDNVSYRYHADAEPALSKISLNLAPGRSVAIVGASGSGKSTLLRLILGLAHPSTGKLLYDGLNATELDMDDLRQRFAVVLQQPFTLSGSLRENILLGHPAADDPIRREAILEDAARRAGLLQDISAMPMGFSTIIGEHGDGLSGGQLQRLSLARALARGPALLVLDEATNNLDSLTEAHVVAAIEKAGCSVLTVAHRLATVRNADEILVMDQGRIVERGSHAELIAMSGHYARLVDSQTL